MIPPWLLGWMYRQDGWMSKSRYTWLRRLALRLRRTSVRCRTKILRQRATSEKELAFIDAVEQNVLEDLLLRRDSHGEPL